MIILVVDILHQLCTCLGVAESSVVRMKRILQLAFHNVGTFGLFSACVLLFAEYKTNVVKGTLLLCCF
jgi:hypothetical protein